MNLYASSVDVWRRLFDKELGEKLDFLGKFFKISIPRLIFAFFLTLREEKDIQFFL